MEAMTPQQRVVADSILAGPRSGGTGLRGPFEALLRSPGLAAPAEQLGVHIRFRSSIPRALNELAILMVARRWNAQFEWYAHRAMALDAGLDPEVADAIATGATPRLDPDGQAVHRFVTDLLERADVGDASWQAVVERWGKEGAIDLIGAVGYYTLVSMILNVDRYPIPEGASPLPELAHG
jgi:4-carboxymuconolactone decarboxylase